MTEINPESVYRQHLETGQDWAEKQAAYQLLDDVTKSIKSAEMMAAKQAESCAMNEAEAIALSSSAYRDHLQSVAEARTAALKAKVRFDSIKVLWEARRTLEASERAAMRAG